MILARVWQEVSTKGQGGNEKLLGKSVFTVDEKKRKGKKVVRA